VATLPFPGDRCQLAGGVTASVPGYELLDELGRGGMGVVYKARQVGLDRVVALKMILAGGHASAEELDRFRREAEAAARLQHPNIAQVYEIGEVGGLPYFSLEYCPGGTLAAQLRGTPLPPARGAALVEQLALAVHFAHGHGVVHRDLKPANVLLVEDGSPKVADFGLAKRLDGVTCGTATGAVLGTPSYMAPEQASGEAKRIGPAADVYALGAILYECLTGRPPFKAATAVDTILLVLEHEPVPPSRVNAHTPRDLVTVCLKCLEKDPAKRYATAADLAEDLRAFRECRPIRAKPCGRLERAVKAALRHPREAAVACVAVVVASLLLYPLASLDQRVLQAYAAALDAMLKGIGAFPLMGVAVLAVHAVVYVMRQRRPWRETAWGVAILLTALVPSACLLMSAVSLLIRLIAVGF
jgi:serine/threonine-protein kinase